MGERRQIPILYAGQRPEVPENGVHLGLSERLGRLHMMRFKDAWFKHDGQPKVFDDVFVGEDGRPTHVVFFAKAHQYEDGALFVVSVLESAEELIVRCQAGVELHVEADLTHGYYFYYPN